MGIYINNKIIIVYKIEINPKVLKFKIGFDNICSTSEQSYTKQININEGGFDHENEGSGPGRGPAGSQKIRW